MQRWSFLGVCICGDVYSPDGKRTRLDLMVKGERSKVQIKVNPIVITFLLRAWRLGTRWTRNTEAT